MRKIVIFIKQKCSECFRESRREDTEDFTEWLVQSRLNQMHIIPKKSSDGQDSPRISPTAHGPTGLPPDLAPDPFILAAPIQSSLHMKRREHLLNSELREDLFYSIESKEEAEGPLTRGSLGKLPESWNRSSGDSVEECGIYTNAEDCRVQTEAERLAAWMRSEYAGKARNFQVRSAVRLRAQGRGLTGLLLHKLEDFKVSFLGESGSPFLSLTSRGKSLVAHFQVAIVGSSSSRLSQVLAYYRIQCSTLAITDLLRFFRSRELLRGLHGFSDVGLCQLEGWEGQELPQLAVRQGRRQLHIAWQMSEVHSADEEGSQKVLEVGFSMDEGEGGWQRLVKYHISKKGSIEVYVESFEETGPLESNFLTSKFMAFEKLLIKRKVIDK